MPIPQLQHYNILDTMAKAEAIKGARTRNKITKNVLNYQEQDRPAELATRASDTAYNEKKRGAELKGMDIDQAVKDISLMQTKLKVARDQLPAVTPDTYDDYLDWLQNTVKLDTRPMPSPDEVAKMAPGDWEATKKKLIMQADDVINMDIEQFKQQAAMDRTKQTGRDAMARTKQSGRDSIEAAQIRSETTDKEPWRHKIERESKEELRKRYRYVRDQINKVMAGVDIMGISEDKQKSIENWQRELEATEKEYKKKGGTVSELGAEEGPKFSHTATNPDTGEKMGWDGSKWVKIQ
jgi:hypothetical protein